MAENDEDLDFFGSFENDDAGAIQDISEEEMGFFSDTIIESPNKPRRSTGTLGSVLGKDRILGTLGRGAEVLFSPLSASAAAVKAQIYGVDPVEAFENRMLQAAGVAEVIEFQSQGRMTPTKTPEDQVLDAARRGEIDGDDAFGNGKFALSVLVDIGEAFVPIGAAGKTEEAKAAVKAVEDALPKGRKIIHTTAEALKRSQQLQKKASSGLKETLQKSASGQKIGVLARTANSVDSQLKKLGSEGRELASRMEMVRDKTEINAGRLIEDMRKNLSRLSKKETDNLVDVLDGQAKPINDKVAQAAVEERARLNSLFDRAQQSLPPGEAPAFRENYFPHMFDNTKFGNPEFRNKAVRDLVDSGQASNLREAEKIINEMTKKTKGRKFGNLETQRLNGVDGWDRDPLKALSSYYYRGERRLAEAQFFGSGDEIAKNLIQKIDDAGLDSGFAQRNFLKYTGADEVDEGLRNFANAVTGFEVVSKMALSQITNAPQGLVNTALKTNATTALKALRQSFTKEGREFARKTGALLETTLDEIAEIGDEARHFSKAPKKFLDAIGFSAAEAKNRTIAALGGKMRAEFAFDQLKAGKSTKRMRRILDELGVNVEDALKRGSLNEDELLTAGLRMSNITQFRTGIMEMPEFFKSPVGRIFGQFKSFALNHGKFVVKAFKDDILDIKVAAKAGNSKEVARMLTELTGKMGVATTAGFAATYAKDLVKSGLGGKEAEIDLSLNGVIESLGAVGGMGIFTDFIRSLQFGEGGVTGFLLGPAAGDFARIVGKTGKETFKDGIGSGLETAAKEIGRTFGPLRGFID